ncbi:hypothetical protein MNEG_11229 [Monoraphidium neglectum]|uniref:Uncharacterized protein n=1 Tax=Monoraphidium neglectum TaxID=145388 RepID=A0A0D2M692_9CHLO|nr:hypothetical protein MNEG_11229 [Monoraphidium neglectum]KIY96731.1 hypothetical protein MNEG_11229 [Monoraphidium neglectum]|eukprot:XP_013895751.1 hypothetical protein MNEG_11229 [Monoraphidium neglectum]
MNKSDSGAGLPLANGGTSASACAKRERAWLQLRQNTPWAVVLPVLVLLLLAVAVAPRAWHSVRQMQQQLVQLQQDVLEVREQSRRAPPSQQAPRKQQQQPGFAEGEPLVDQGQQQSPIEGQEVGQPAQPTQPTQQRTPGGAASPDANVAPSPAPPRQPRRRGQRWCPYGDLPGTWVSGGPPGTRWQLLDGTCRLRDLLGVYAPTNSTAAAASATGATPGRAGGERAAATSAPPPPLRLLLLSDSVDRYITGHLCDWLGGTQDAQLAPEVLHAAAASAAGAGASDGASAGHGGARRARMRVRLRRRALLQRAARDGPQQEPGGQGGGADAAPGGRQQPTNVYSTAYSLHKCVVTSPLKVASSYFPGVHPTGPWHRNVTQSFRKRIDSAAALWREFAGNQDPDIVSVSALLWDLARLWFHERGAVQGPELSRDLLQGWMANFTDAVAHARTAFPNAKVFATHTTLPPRFKPSTGLAAKPYLGRPYYVAQLNAALRTVAAELGLQVVDYAQIGGRFLADQSYLVDLIHPVRDVGLEIINVYLNLAAQAQATPPPPLADAGG